MAVLCAALGRGVLYSVFNVVRGFIEGRVRLSTEPSWWDQLVGRWLAFPSL